MNSKHLNMVLFINYIVSYQQLDNFQHLKKDFENADILIINRIKSYNDYTIQNLKQILKKDVLLIVIPFVRFEGYWKPENYKRLTKIGDNAVKEILDIQYNLDNIFICSKKNIYQKLLIMKNRRSCKKFG